MALRMVRSKLGLRSRLMAAMSYMGILCFVPLILNDDDQYVYFHSKQGLIIWMWGVIGILSLHVPGIGKWFFSFSAMAVLVLSAIGLIAVLLNKAWKLPFIHSLAARI